MIIGAWISVMLVLYLLFSGWESNQLNPNRQPVSKISSDGDVEVVLQRNAYDHYVSSGYINGQKVTFLVDTGATNVVVPMHLANRLKLRPGTEQRIRTANGTVIARHTVIDRLSIGQLELDYVDATLNPGMPGNEILLGMSVLGEVELIQRGDELRIRSSTEGR